MKKSRTGRFQKRLEKKGIDAALLIGTAGIEPNLEYFSGARIDYSFLLIPKKGNPVLFAPNMEFEKARRLSAVRDVRRLEKPAYSFVARALKRRRPQVVGINKAGITLRDYARLKPELKGIRLVDVSQELDRTRMVKDRAELAAIRKACRLTDRAFSLIVQGIRSGRLRTEPGIRNFIEGFALRNSSVLAFEPIVASGKSSSMPHYRPMNRPLKRGFCILDFGIKHKGYCSDMTRTVFLGSPGEAEKRHYRLVLQTQESAIRMAGPGVLCKKLYEHARESLGAKKELFIHGLGHGFGLRIHEMPSLSPDSEDTLLPGTVVTIEPGIYAENRFGIRIEDDILITGSGREVLTHSKKGLISISLGKKKKEKTRAGRIRQGSGI